MLDIEPIMAMQAAPWEHLFQYGAVGAMLAWFMFKVSPTLDAIKRANDRTTRALLLLALAMPDTGPVLQAHVKGLMEELEADSQEKVVPL